MYRFNNFAYKFLKRYIWGGGGQLKIFGVLYRTGAPTLKKHSLKKINKDAPKIVCSPFSFLFKTTFLFFTK